MVLHGPGMNEVKCSTTVTTKDTSVTMSDKKGKLTLHECVESGDLDKLTKLLDDGCPVIDERDGYCKWTPLHEGAQRGHTEIVKVLISHGADVIVKDKNGETPLHRSAQSGHTEIVKLLIQHGADVNVKGNFQETPLHDSASSGHTETVKLLIQHGADIDAVDKSGYTPLMNAELFGHINTAYILRLAKPIQAAHRKFLSSSHDVSTYSSRSAKEKCSTNVTDKEGKLTLHECVRCGDLDKLTRFLNDECLVDERDEDSWTPLCIGAWLGHTEIVKVLISRGADVNVKDKYEWTPLDYMACQGNKEIVEVLISHGADVNTKDIDGDTPLLKSVFEGHKEIGKVLLTNRAEVNVKHKAGYTPLHYSAESGHTEIVNLLIQHRADVNVKDKNGKTPLHYSARSGHTEIVKMLIQQGADVNVKGKNGRTPLHYSAWSGHTEIVKVLIQNGADIDAVDGWRDTPLMDAKKSGHSDIVDIIKQAKSPVTKIKKAFAGFFGYSSRTRKVTVQRTDNKGQITKVKYESSEVRNVTESLETFESFGKGEEYKVKEQKNSHGKGEEDKVKEQKNSQRHIFQELVTTSAETSSYLTTSDADICTSPGPSSQLSTSSLQSSATTSLPSSSPQTNDDDVTRCAQELMKAVKRKKQSGKDDGEVGQGQNCLSVPCDHCDRNFIVIKEKTVNNHYHNTYHNHCQNCQCNKQTICEEVKKDTLKTLDIGVASARHGLLHLRQGDEHEKVDNDEYMTREESKAEKEERDRQILYVDKMDNDTVRNCIRETFVNYIVPDNVMWLFHKYDAKVLTENDVEHVKARTSTNGRMEGAQLLLNRLPLYKNWFPCLIQVLKDEQVKLGHVAEVMQDKVKDLKKSKVKCWISTNVKEYTDPHFSARRPSTGDTNMPSRNQPGFVADQYNMDHPNRGTAVIINNNKFGQVERTGTNVDAQNMQRLLNELCFKNILRYDDLTAEQMRDILEQASKENHSQSDCFVCIILSHGAEGGLVYGVDKKCVNLDVLFSYFKGNKCPSLAGKPKLFFIQACRGSREDRGVTVADGALDIVDDAGGKHIPSEADFLLAYSVVPGFRSWRNIEKGSWFIQAVVDVFTKYWTQMDLLSMMTAVNKKVAEDFEQGSDRIKEMPSITSMLTKLVFFTKKS